MRSSVPTLVFSVLLLVMVIGTFLMPLPVTAAITAKSVTFEPKYMDLDDPDELVTAFIRFSPAKGEDQRVAEINTTTVLFEGSVPAVSGSNSTSTQPPEYSCDFDGPTVRDVIWAKIYHNGMPPNPQGNYVVDLTVAGDLYDGTSFTGTGHIQVKPKRFDGGSPPPPPPS